MNLQQISIVTITLARNEGEEQELTQALNVLASLDLPVIIADGGSTESFLQFLSGFNQFTVLPKSSGGLLGQIRDGLGAAYQAEPPFIFYTEPDKKAFFQNHLLPVLQSVQTTEQTGIVLAARSEKAFASFPPFQQMTETTINNCCREMMQAEMDYCYGPFLMNKKVVPYLSSLKEEAGWGWRPFIFNLANRLQLNVDAITGDFFCPLQQREEDVKERLHRIKQLEQNISGLLVSVTSQL